MQATVQDNKHFNLFNRLPKPGATATVDEWTEQYGVGGFLGGSTNIEDGDAEEANGDYARMVGKVKYLSTYRKIPIVLQNQNNIVDAKALEATNGAKQLLTDIEYLLFEGDDSVVPTEFNGIFTQIASLGSSDHIIDMAGNPLNSIEPISRAAETIFGIDSFGTPTDIYTATSVQTDLNNHLDPAFRLGLTPNAQNTVLGTHVAGIQTSYGAIKTNQDIFIRDEKLKKPFQCRYPAVAVRQDGIKPTLAVTVGAGGADSAWGAAHGGNYYWLVTGVNAKGQSTGVVSAQKAVAAGQQVALDITASVGGQETGYVIYRGRKNGTNDVTDFREMARVGKAAGGVTTYIDKNRDIPGSTVGYVLNLNPADHAISWKQYMPMLEIPMAAVRSPIIPWLQMICGYLRITKRRQHVLVKNIVPTGALWKPFN